MAANTDVQALRAGAEVGFAVGEHPTKGLGAGADRYVGAPPRWREGRSGARPSPVRTWCS